MGTRNNIYTYVAKLNVVFQPCDFDFNQPFDFELENACS